MGALQYLKGNARGRPSGFRRPNLRHPHFRNCLGFYPFLIKSGIGVGTNVCNALRRPQYNFDDAQQFSYNAWTKDGLEFTTSNDHVGCHSDILGGLGEFTILLRIFRRSTANTGAFTKWSGATLQILLRMPGTALQFYTSTSSGNVGGDVGTVNSLQWYDIAARYDGANQECWINLVPGTSRAQTGTINSIASGVNARFGGAGSSEYDGDNIVFEYAYIFDKALPFSRIKHITENPYAPYERRIWVPVSAVVGDTNVGASTDALTLTEQAASIILDVNVNASTDALTLTTYQASIANDVDVDANVDALTLTTYQASIANDVNVSANVDALTLTTYSAALGDDVDVAANVDVLTLATYQASIANDVNVAASTDALTLTELQADVALGVNVQAGVDALTLTEQSASIAYDIDVSTNVDALNLSTHQASIVGGAPVTAAAPPSGVRNRARRRRIVVGEKHYLVNSPEEERQIVEAYVAELNAKIAKAEQPKPKMKRRVTLAVRRLERLDNKVHRRKEDEELALLLAA